MVVCNANCNVRKLVLESGVFMVDGTHEVENNNYFVTTDTLTCPSDLHLNDNCPTFSTMALSHDVTLTISLQQMIHYSQFATRSFMQNITLQLCRESSPFLVSQE